MQVVADVFERRSSVPGRLRSLGIDVIERPLAVGDYAVSPVCLIERKSILDLHSSVYSGRLWRQIGALRRACEWPYLLVEGSPLYAGALGAEGVRGLLLAISDLGVTVIRSDDAADSAHWIRRILMRRTRPVHRNRPPYARRRATPLIAPAEVALAAAPGISTATARRLLEHFGSLLHVLLASPDDLRSVRGVGTRRADAIQKLARDPLSYSGESRNGLGSRHMINASSRLSV
jgi:DNA excision repair protein ERCC-4